MIPTGRAGRSSLERMLSARSVAVVGASVKEASLGRQMMLELERGGFEGAVYPVNPGYDEVLGHRCFASLGDVPEPVDLAILGVANQRVEQAMRDAAHAGAASVLTFSSLFEEEPQGAGAPPLAERVAAIAREHGMALCGGNGMGFVNTEARLRATGFPTPDEMPPGSVAFLSHSGSAFAAFAFNDRGIAFNLIVSSGQEIVTTMDEYLSFALDLESTKVAALVLETVRSPDGFLTALAEAKERGVPVLALKVGRTEGAKEMVVAHSGALAGEHGAYEAVFDAYGVHECRDLEELADAIELFSNPRRVTGGTGIASLHDSGGERALFVDLAADLGIPLAKISDPTRERIDAVLDPGLVAENPLDAWGTGIDADRIYVESFLALHDDPETAAVAFVVDLTRQGEPYDAGYLRVATDVFEATTKPFCVVSNLPAAIARDEVGRLRSAGIPVLEGTVSGLRALDHLLDDASFRRRTWPTEPDVRPKDHHRRWRAVLAATKDAAFTESMALEFLADYGIPVVKAEHASSLDEVEWAAEGIGFPLAVKTAMPTIAHKSEVRGVRLNVQDVDELRETYRDLSARLGPDVTIAEMAPPGVEVALGMVRDPTFGPLVLVAAGGVLVELVHDRKLAVPPVDEGAARRLIDGLAIRPLLDGVRGAPPADVDALARAVSRLSVLAVELGDLIAELDINPVIVSPHGCVAVDVLVVT
ncbi:MAG TPA: acetate--CoA ligase family protein [Actinomycetota bacterium]|nr:acetate--CoA ligase family protein [Actinomycetota bacterium]